MVTLVVQSPQVAQFFIFNQLILSYRLSCFLLKFTLYITTYTIPFPGQFETSESENGKVKTQFDKHKSEFGIIKKSIWFNLNV